ncbi:MAG: GNAT family N-acetyltransferase [Lachnospiraceae bacterium]|nr:GNAT family N-acetyltransferase [Lachnospiraceae bacterium]
MVFDKAKKQDISQLKDLRVAYLQEDLGEISQEDLNLLETSLPGYFEKHMDHDLDVYVARKEDEIVSCAFLLMVEKPMSPAFITGKTGTVLNVYTKPEHRHKGYAKQLMTMMTENAKDHGVCVIELKATVDGYGLYRAIGFEDVTSRYRNMKIVL